MSTNGRVSLLALFPDGRCCNVRSAPARSRCARILGRSPYECRRSCGFRPAASICRDRRHGTCAGGVRRKSCAPPGERRECLIGRLHRCCTGGLPSREWRPPVHAPSRGAADDVRPSYAWITVECPAAVYSLPDSGLVYGTKSPRPTLPLIIFEPGSKSLTISMLHSSDECVSVTRILSSRRKGRPDVGRLT